MSGSYDFEEQERLAELKAWWEDNRWYVVGAIAAAIIAFSGYHGWKWWTLRQAEDAAAMFAPVEQAVRDKEDAKVASLAEPLIAKHPNSYFASEAALMIAKAAFEAGKLPEAAQRLEWVMAHGVQEHRGVARVRLAAVLLDQKKYDEALKVLDGNHDEAFAPLVADMRGDVMFAQGRLDEARAAYKLAVDRAPPTNPVRNIAGTKLNALGGEK